MKFEAMDLGLVDYAVADRIQREILDSVKSQICKGILFLAEFLPVYTIGRSGSLNNLLISVDFLRKNGIKCYHVDRGGDITAHSPGQLVVYPIFNLGSLKKDLDWYLRSLEEIVIKLLFGYGIACERRSGRTGAWIGGKKIASIGISVSRWITYHGLSLNVNNDLSFFDFINPCGIKECKVTSLSRLKGQLIDMGELKRRLIEQFERNFDIEIGEQIPLVA